MSERVWVCISVIFHLTHVLELGRFASAHIERCSRHIIKWGKKQDAQQYIQNFLQI